MRIKPQPYYTIPESTLNRIFTEIREATQFIVLQIQKLIFGENLSNTFIVSQYMYYSCQVVIITNLIRHLQSHFAYIGSLSYLLCGS